MTTGSISLLLIPLVNTLRPILQLLCHPLVQHPMISCILRRMTSFKTLKRRQQLQHNKRTRYKPFRIYVRTKHGGRILNKRLSVKVKRGSKTCWARHTAPLLNCSVFQTIGTDPRKYTAHQDHSYDTDSHEIGIDNHASYSMTNNLKDYVGKPRRVRVRVKGIAGRLMSGYVGTVRWRLLDDNGALHILDIPNTYYVPAIPIRLLSPQHLAQQMRRKEKRPDGTFCATFADRATLLWNDRQFIKTIHLNHANVPVFRSAPSYERYGLFEREYNSIAREPKIFATHLIPPDDDDDPIEDEGAEEPTLRPQQQEDEHQLEQSEAISATPSTNEGGNPTQLCFEIPSTTEEDGDQHKLDIPVVEDENTPHLEDPTKDLLIWHYRLGHLPFSRVQAMAKAGDLPKRLASCRIPECAACRFGKATKVPWRVEIARVPKLRPRTRHINVIYHHFRNEVANKRLLVLPIATTHQQADFLTKACDRTTFERHRRSVLGW